MKDCLQRPSTSTNPLIENEQHYLRTVKTFEKKKPEHPKQNKNINIYTAKEYTSHKYLNFWKNKGLSFPYLMKENFYSRGEPMFN